MNLVARLSVKKVLTSLENCFFHRSFKQGKESLGKLLVLFLLLCKTLTRYDTDVCGVPTKNALEIILFVATFLIDSE